MCKAMKWFWPAISAALLCGVVRASEDGALPLAVWQLPGGAPAAGAD